MKHRTILATEILICQVFFTRHIYYSKWLDI